jgi:hypothetical protein
MEAVTRDCGDYLPRFRVSYTIYTRPCYNFCVLGDDWLRRLRLVPDCEPRGADLVKPAQNFKCQKH